MEATPRLNLKGAAARSIIRRAPDDGLACPRTEKGPLIITFPPKAPDASFPRLFSDLAMHHVAEREPGLPQSSREAFSMLKTAGILTP